MLCYACGIIEIVRNVYDGVLCIIIILGEDTVNTDIVSYILIYN